MAALEARSAAGPAEDIPAPKEPFAKLLRRERVLEERLKLQAAGVHMPLAALVDYNEFGLDVAFDDAVYPPRTISLRSVRRLGRSGFPTCMRTYLPRSWRSVNARP
ncbi:hypothetical protein PAPYR_12851 [Paratrimastix pyriformis]|uniref:Uncharacterized protein n=1 Tax=Paratrimastix pyriformis TaxID=342808 RepID=A0ABQ8U615_9EUKA|nr:hypothetical protein PAPYR_13043 [Paratrimastix pyriformis]KAJ4452860.1 hypothetical protein PAPYR_12851 [Paratrimastix pyriformis]